MSNRRSLRDFYRRLEALRAKDLRRTLGARTACCRDELRRLDERRRLSTVPEQAAQITADMAVVRMYLAGECLFPDGLSAEAAEEGEIALREALSSGQTVIIYECLGSLGSLYLTAGNEENAIVCFQRAMAYAQDPADPSRLKYREVLRWLGNVWGRSEQTLPLARMSAQWRRALDAHDLAPWRDEYLWLVQFRRDDEVSAAVDGPAPDSPLEAARRTAALLALGRYDDAMDAVPVDPSRSRKAMPIGRAPSTMCCPPKVPPCKDASLGGIIDRMATEWTGREYAGESFEGMELEDLSIKNCRFTGCRFVCVNLSESTTEYAVFDNCDFTDARMNGSVHRHSCFANCRFRGANLLLAQFLECKSVGSDLTESRMDAAVISGGDWSLTNFRHVDLEKFDARGTKFDSADFYGANLKSADFRDCDLNHANLAQAKLTGIDLRGAILTGIDLSVLDLKKAKLDMGQAILFARSHGIVVG